MLTDIEIARQAELAPITDIAAKIDLTPDELDLYGKYKAKIPLDVLKKVQSNPDGKLVLVTAMNPTPAGEGKTTVSIGLAQGFTMTGTCQETDWVNTFWLHFLVICVIQYVLLLIIVTLGMVVPTIIAMYKRPVEALRHE